MAKTTALPARKPATTRERFVSMTAKLMSRRGYAGTGLNEIVAKSGAPKGSLYHFFPAGKEQLAAAAVDWAAECFLATLTEAIARSGSAAAAVGALAAQIAVWMEESGCKDGSPLTIVAVETGAFVEPLRLACQRGYQAWADALADQLRRDGKPAKEASDLALWAVASLEGAIVLARTQHSAEPLRRIGKLLQKALT
ncbi:TetR/AcrR family transcriptional regulator [Ferrovibrio terrae]|uniref:TetR/AcrR family transcriptional regulator n=1 Tax=Ferrovibrio terrae TaxID=2594003 RepID=UPI003137A2A9